MIIFINGPMFSSKSSRLIEYYNRATYKDKRNVLAFKPTIDNRDDGVIRSRGGLEIEAIKINSILDIEEYLFTGVTDIFIDEVNFFENIPNDNLSVDFFKEREKRIHEIILFLEKLNYELGINIFMAGLVFDSEIKPFGISPYLLNIATSVDYLTAVCVKCNHPATHTNYKGYKDENILVGSDEYEALCAHCWIEAQKDKNK